MAYFTALGDDPYSLVMLKFINEGNILTDCIRTIEGKRAGLYVVHQENGDHQFPYWRENSAARLLADDTQALSSAIDGADCLYFSGITLAILEPKGRRNLLRAIGTARKNNALVAFDSNIRVSLWPDRDKLIQSLRDATSVSDRITLFSDISQGQMIARYLAAGAGEVISKKGANPVRLSTGEATVIVPVEEISDIKDASEAGDSFNGAYLAARLNGSGPEDAARAGIAIATTVIRHQGALIPR